eukprot:1686760-Alexandrium_andersonii.AAC.1
MKRSSSPSRHAEGGLAIQRAKRADPARAGPRHTWHGCGHGRYISKRGGAAWAAPGCHIRS